MNEADGLITTRRRFITAAATSLLIPSWPRASPAQSSRSLIDSAGRSVGLPARVERIYVAGPPAGILVFAVAPDKLLGWANAWREAEKPYIPPRYRELPVLGRVTGRGNTANVESLLAARPDVIVDYGAVTPTYVSLADRVQEQTRIPYILLDGAFERIAAAMEAIGTIAGTSGNAARLVRYTQETLATITQRIAQVPVEKRPSVYYARGPNGLTTGLAGSINVEIIERVGARNAAAELGRGGLVQVSFEQVVKWDPDAIVTIDPNFFDEARRSALWRGLRAVKEGRIHLAPSVPYGWVDFPPSVNRLIGLHWLARILYPERFPEDLRPLVREFYALFYHQTPTDEQLNRLLASDSRER